MSKKKTLRTIAQCLIIVAFCALGAASRSHKQATVSTFTAGSPGWAQININKDTDYDLAFDDVVSVLSRNFEIEVLSPETGYVRTKWNTTWLNKEDGTYQKNYRVRCTIKMSKQRMRIDINTEAEWYDGKVWIIGYDTQALATLKQDITGVVGS